MKLNRTYKIMCVLGIILILIDQTSKILVNRSLNEDVKIIPNNVLTITKVENEGIAFGLNKQNLGNIFLSLIVIISIFNYIITQKENITMLPLVYLIFIISGGISNVIDRVFKGAVFDFIKIGNFPVFNFADMCIVCGWALFAIHFVKDTAIDIKLQ